jgi:hypothetical protein
MTGPVGRHARLRKPVTPPPEAASRGDASRRGGKPGTADAPTRSTPQGIAGPARDEIVRSEREDRVVCAGFSHEVTEPRDASSGRETGKRTEETPALKAQLRAPEEDGSDESPATARKKGPPPPVVPGAPPRAAEDTLPPKPRG